VRLKLIASFSIAVTCSLAAPRPVILTTDCGADMDDQWALAHLALSSEFDVRAVVTTHTGKFQVFPAPAAEGTAKVARDVLAHMPLRSRPVVIPGSSVALSSRSALLNAGVERILSESRGFNREHRLTVLVIGAGTDTASALLSDKGLADRIEIVAMGFDRWPQGGDGFNILNDPIAWQVILDSNVPVTVGDGTVTKRDLGMTSEHAHSILDSAGDPGRYLAGLLDQFLATQRDLVVQITGDPGRWPVWDEVTVAYLKGLTKSEDHPRPKLRPDLSFEHGEQGNIQWITAIDGDRLWTDLASQLKR